MKIDWYNVLRTLVQAFIVIIGFTLPLLTAEWWAAIGVDSVTFAPILGSLSLALAAWWRQRYQDAFEGKSVDLRGRLG